MYYFLEQKRSEFYVRAAVPREIKRGCRDSEFQFLDRRPLELELENDYGTEFPDLIMAEDYVPFISERLKRLFDRWGIDNLFYKKILLKMPDFDVREQYWLALPPRIDCLDPEEALDPELGVCVKIAIIANRVGNYQIFKLKNGNDEIIITKELREKLQKELDSQTIRGIIIKKCESEV